MDELVIAINTKSSPSASSVQALIQEHYVWLKRTWTPTNDSYLGLIDLYQTPEFRKFYDNKHPGLLAFLVKAMQIFAKNKLS